MQGFAINVFLSCSILLPAAVAIFRIRFIDHNFYPFIFLVWLGLINEVLSIVLAYTIRNNSTNSNIYTLFEYALILFQFYKWDELTLKRYYFFVVLGLVVWTGDNLIFNSISSDNSVFRIFYSFIIIFFSINQINKTVIYEMRSLIKNASFLISISFLIYYSCKAFMEVFNIYHADESFQFIRNVLMILYVANFLSNINYAIAILCIRLKQEFIMPY